MKRVAVGFFLVLAACGGNENVHTTGAFDAAPPPNDARPDHEPILGSDDAGSDASKEASACAMSITSVSPGMMCSGKIQIDGSGFAGIPAVLASCNTVQGVTALTNVQWISSNRLTGELAPISPWGWCDIIVVNPDACESVLPKALQLWCEGPQ